jgi:hypothetical protein
MKAEAMLLPLLLGITACTQDCSLLPCFEGLLISLDDKPAVGTSVEVRPEGGAPIVVDCDETACWPTLHLSEVTADQVTIVVTSPAGEVTADFDPEYRRREPNGPGCGSCVNAEIAMQLP